MFSKSLASARICLQCRLSLAPARAQRWTARGPCPSLLLRKYSDNRRLLTKEQAEALILGKPVTEKSHTTNAEATATRTSETADSATASPSTSPTEEQQTVLDSDASTEHLEDGIPNIDEPPKASTRKRRENPLLRHQALGVDSLGQPVEALVINNPNQLRPQRKSTRISEDESSTPFISSKWSDWVPNPNITPQEELDEICANIEELRPTQSTVIPHKEFMEIAEALVSGFSKDQITTYAVRNTADNDNVNNESVFSWVASQASWRPEAELLPAKLKPKQYAVVHMMRSVWNLEIEEEISGLGTTTLSVQPQHFALLTRYNPQVLESIRAELRDGMNNEQIAIHSKAAQINILSKKLTASVVLSRLDEFFSRVRSKTISVKKNPKLGSLLQEISRVTNTIVESIPGSTNYVVYWVADSLFHTPEELVREDKADVVWRLLSTESAEPEYKSRQIIWPTSGVRSGFHMPYHRDKRCMSWKDKTQAWSRFVTQRSKGDLPEAQTRIKIPTLPSSPQSQASGIKTTLSASFGQILYQSDILKSFDQNVNRILAAASPHPAALSNVGLGEDESSTLPLSTDIVLNFSCDPSYTGHPGRMPEIRLRLPIGQDTDLSAFVFPPTSSLTATLALSEHDMLLPGSSVDVRINQVKHLALDVSQPALEEFVAQSAFNLLEGRLHTPARTTFDLPYEWFGDSSKTDGSVVQRVPYVFMGLEIDQSVQTSFEGHTLRYSSVEAGHHGGQRQQLTLLLGSPDNNGLVDEAANQADFLRVAHRVAAGKFFSWDTGHQLMLSRLHEELVLDLEDEDDFAESSDAGQQLPSTTEQDDVKEMQTEEQVASEPVEDAVINTDSSAVVHDEVKNSLEETNNDDRDGKL